MEPIEAVKFSLELTEGVVAKYLNELSNEDFMLRPHPKSNHINYQVGHLICYENKMIGKQESGCMPELPNGFREKYDEKNAVSDDASQFATKEVLMATYESQRAATKKFLERQTPDELDLPSGVDYAPTRGKIISMQGLHWMMHTGQWVAIRRMTEKPVVI